MNDDFVKVRVLHPTMLNTLINIYPVLSQSSTLLTG